MKDNLGKRNSFKDSGSEGGMILSARIQGDISQPEEQQYIIYYQIK
jgi:hypothetical protein